MHVQAQKQSSEPASIHVQAQKQKIRTCFHTCTSTETKDQDHYRACTSIWTQIRVCSPKSFMHSHGSKDQDLLLCKCMLGTKVKICSCAGTNIGTKIMITVVHIEATERSGPAPLHTKSEIRLHKDQGLLSSRYKQKNEDQEHHFNHIQA